MATLSRKFDEELLQAEGSAPQTQITGEYFSFYTALGAVSIIHYSSLY